MSKWRDCLRCPNPDKLEGRRCTNCGGKGILPRVPPVGETVQWRRPLNKWEQERIESGDRVLDPEFVLFRPLLVTHADLVHPGNERYPYVRVTGWVTYSGHTAQRHFPEKSAKEDATWVEGLGWVIPKRSQPRQVWVEEVRGPSDDPGCWRWRGEPK